MATAPLPVYFVVQAVVFGVLTYVLGQLIGPDHESWIGHAIGGVLFGALMTLWIARQRRRNGGAQAMVDQALALKKGHLPEGADPQVWSANLDRQERTQRRLRRIVPVEFGAFAAVGVWLALTQGAVWWAFVAFFVLAGVGGVVATTRTLHRIDRLRGELLHR
jgi:hypothetical protein